MRMRHCFHHSPQEHAIVHETRDVCTVYAGYYTEIAIGERLSNNASTYISL